MAESSSEQPLSRKTAFFGFPVVSICWSIFGLTFDRSISKSIPLENQKRPFSSIGVALIKNPWSKIDPKIDSTSVKNRYPWKTKNSDSVREGVAKSMKNRPKLLSAYSKKVDFASTKCMSRSIYIVKSRGLRSALYKNLEFPRSESMSKCISSKRNQHFQSNGFSSSVVHCCSSCR